MAQRGPPAPALRAGAEPQNRGAAEGHFAPGTHYFSFCSESESTQGLQAASQVRHAISASLWNNRFLLVPRVITFGAVTGFAKLLK